MFPERPEEYEEPSRDFELDRLSDQDEDQVIYLSQVRKFLTENGAFQRLVQRIQSAARLTTGQAIQSIREKIINVLTNRYERNPGEAHHYQTSSEIPWSPQNLFSKQYTHRARFEVSWDPETFISKQYTHEGGDMPKIEEVIAITGSAIEAQALTCGEYMRQVWPTSRMETLQALQAAIDCPAKRHSCKVSSMPMNACECYLL